MVVSTFVLPSDNRKLVVSPVKRVKTTHHLKSKNKLKTVEGCKKMSVADHLKLKGRKTKMIKRLVKIVNEYSLFWVRGRCRSLVRKFCFLKLFYFRVICYFLFFMSLIVKKVELFS